MERILCRISVIVLTLFFATCGMCYYDGTDYFWVNTPQEFYIYIRYLAFYTGENQTGDAVTVINNPDGVSANVCQTGGAYRIFASGISIPVGTYESYRMICRAKFRMKGVVYTPGIPGLPVGYYYTSSTAQGNAGGPATTEAVANSSAVEAELSVPAEAPEPDDSGDFTTPVVVTEGGTTNIRFLWSPTNELELWFRTIDNTLVLRPIVPAHDDQLTGEGVPTGAWGPGSGGQVD